MTSPLMNDLIARIAADTDLQHRFATADSVQALSDAVRAAGFDPEDPDIARGLGLEAELDESALESMAGGQGWVDSLQSPSASMAVPGLNLSDDWK